jgi:hypothetical protein
MKVFDALRFAFLISSNRFGLYPLLDEFELEYEEGDHWPCSLVAGFRLSGLLPGCKHYLHLTKAFERFCDMLDAGTVSQGQWASEADKLLKRCHRWNRTSMAIREWSGRSST